MVQPRPCHYALPGDNPLMSLPPFHAIEPRWVFFSLVGTLAFALPDAAPALDRAARTSAASVRAHPAPVDSRALEPYQRDAAYRLAAPEVLARPEMCAPTGDVSDANKPFALQIESAARDAGIDPALVHAVIAVESAYRPGAVSPKGAVGLMQVMPATALRYGVRNPADVADNLRAGTRHLRMLMQMFGDRLDLVLAAYNAGEGAVRKHGDAIPPYPETRNYVPAVLARFNDARPAPRPVAAAPRPEATPLQRDYLSGTRLDPTALARLP